MQFQRGSPSQRLQLPLLKTIQKEPKRKSVSRSTWQCKERSRSSNLFVSTTVYTCGNSQYAIDNTVAVLIVIAAARRSAGDILLL